MASLGRLGGLGAQVKPEPSVKKPPLGRMRKAWEIAKLLAKNEFTRGIGRDVLMFGASVVLIRIIISILAEEGGAAGGGGGGGVPSPLPNIPG